MLGGGKRLVAMASLSSRRAVECTYFTRVEDRIRRLMLAAGLVKIVHETLRAGELHCMKV